MVSQFTKQGPPEKVPQIFSIPWQIDIQAWWKSFRPSNQLLESPSRSLAYGFVRSSGVSVNYPSQHYLISDPTITTCDYAGASGWFGASQLVYIASVNGVPYVFSHSYILFTLYLHRRLFVVGSQGLSTATATNLPSPLLFHSSNPLVYSLMHRISSHRYCLHVPPPFLSCFYFPLVFEG